MSRRIPGYLRHKARHKGKVIIDRKTIYLDGDYGSPESRRHYDRLIAELLSKPENRPDLINVTIARLAVSCVAYAKGGYQKMATQHRNEAGMFGHGRCCERK